MNNKLKDDQMSKVSGGISESSKRYPDPNYNPAFYRVKTGDTVSSIAESVKCTPAEIISWNNLKKDIPLMVGASLKYYTHFIYQ